MGTEDDPRGIEVNGCLLTVRGNCRYALWQMRHREKQENMPPQCYWIDALCIDQGAHAERGLQVGQMGKITSSAESVAACLGIEASEDLLRHESNVATGTPADTTAETILRVVSLPYFSRLWVIQECMLASKLQSFAGAAYRDRQFLLNKLQSYLGQRLLKSADLHDLSGPMSAALGLGSDGWHNLPASYNGSQRTLPHLIAKHGRRECLDPRDKIYALLSLTDAVTREAFNVSYDQSLFDTLEHYLLAHSWVPAHDWRAKEQVDRTENGEEFPMLNARFCDQRVVLTSQHSA